MNFGSKLILTEPKSAPVGGPPSNHGMPLTNKYIQRTYIVYNVKQHTYILLIRVASYVYLVHNVDGLRFTADLWLYLDLLCTRHFLYMVRSV